MSDETTDIVLSDDAPLERDSKTGRFLPGNRGGPGLRAWQSESNRLRWDIKRRIMDAITPEEWDSIKTALVRKAMNGDVKAIRLLLEYSIGKPVQAIDMSVTAAAITPEEAQDRIRAFFGLKE